MSIKKLYVATSLLTLALSTIGWSLAAARLGQGNADQLANGFLFENAKTFSAAQFPASHTQLIKWPLFWLLAMLHNAELAYLVTTVGIAVLTVGLLVWLVYRINHQPLVFGTVCLGIACVLASVPAQVQGNITAPLSLAMITGRNLEYLVYIASLVLLTRATTVVSWRWVGAVGLLGLLLASDRLFVPVTIAGGIVLWLVASLRKHVQLSTLARRWILGSAAAWLVAGALLWLVRQFTYVVGQTNSPYGWVDNSNNLYSALIGLWKGSLLNVGITAGAGKVTVVTALINAFIAGLALYAVVKTIRRIRSQSSELDNAQLLLVMMVLSSVVVAALYVTTDHPYAVDARYLSLIFYMLVIAVAIYTRSLSLSPKYWYMLGSVLALAAVVGTTGVWQHTNQVMARSELSRRNAAISQALSTHPDLMLVGDYWRVLPVKGLSKDASLQIMPLTSCVQPRQVLTSTIWNKPLQTHSFAYLLPILPAGTPYGTCTLGLVQFLYGPPSSTVVIAGTARSPTELLVFYNDGAADNHGKRMLPPRPVLGAPTDGKAMPTGSTMTPLETPS